jgi:hypothetical protein
VGQPGGVLEGLGRVREPLDHLGGREERARRLGEFGRIEPVQRGVLVDGPEHLVDPVAL